MNLKKGKIEKIITREKESIQKKRSNVEAIELEFDQNRKGKYLTKLRAKMSNKTLYLVEENYCPEISVRKVFNNLKRLLEKKKFRKPQRLMMEFDTVS